MGVLADIGTAAGQAAPGEYSPSALLTARGDTIVRDVNGPVRLGKGSAGTFLGYNATDLAALIPPGYPIVDLGRSYTPSATTEGSLLAGGAALAGVLGSAANAVKDFWHIKLSGTLLNNSGTNTYTSRIRGYFGAYPFLDVTSAVLTSSATTREWAWEALVLVETVGAAGTGTLRVSGRRLGLDNAIAVGTGYKTLTANTYAEDVAESTGTSVSPALITNAAQDFNVTATHSNATALMTTALTECIIRHYPQNR